MYLFIISFISACFLTSTPSWSDEEKHSKKDEPAKTFRQMQQKGNPTDFKFHRNVDSKNPPKTSQKFNLQTPQKPADVKPNPQTFQQSTKQTQEQTQKFDDRRLKEKHDDFNKRFSYFTQQKRQTANKIRAEINYRQHNKHLWFNRDFFNKHHAIPYYYQHNINWWRVPHWSYVNVWINSQWQHPIYYDDEDYPLEIDSKAYMVENYQYPISGDWLPLGVFALADNESSAADTDIFFQIAINREGLIAGTYYNTSSDTTYPIEGMINKANQQAVWKVANSPKSPELRTGIYNLTLDQTPVEVQFSDGTVQSWILINLKPSTLAPEETFE